MNALKALPRTIKVGPFPFTVKLWDACTPDVARAFGNCCTTTSTISLQPQFKSAAQAVDTVLHEVNHAIYWAYGVDDEDKEERVVAIFATAWTQVFQDNPALMAWVAKWTKPQVEETRP